MAQLAVAWVPQNSNVSAAIVGASRPEQVTENAGVAGVRLDAGLLKAVDQVLDPVAQRDPGLTVGHRATADMTRGGPAGLPDTVGVRTSGRAPALPWVTSGCSAKRCARGPAQG